MVVGSVQHLISRFVNREFLFDAPGAHEEYLVRAARAFARNDWVAIGYALMSSHVHWIARAGSTSSDSLLRGLHCGFSGWLNRSTGRLGPVFADRHRNVECGSETALALLAYVHNNPVRARVVADPADSTWTSHRAYLGLDSGPPWLDVELGMTLCGLEPSAIGQASFGAFVREHSADCRREELSGRRLSAARSELRRVLALPVDLASPQIVRVGPRLEQRVDFVVPVSSPPRTLLRITPLEVLELVAEVTSVPSTELRRRSRARRVSRARRLALLVWAYGLNRVVVDMARTLGMAATTASDHIHRSSEVERERALQLVQTLRSRSAALGT